MYSEEEFSKELVNLVRNYYAKCGIERKVGEQILNKPYDPNVRMIAVEFSPSCCACLPVRDFYKLYIQGESLEKIVSDIAENIITQDTKTEFDKIKLFDKSFIEEAATFRLMDIEENNTFLEDCIYDEFHGFALVYYMITKSDENGFYATKMTESLLEQMNMSKEDFAKMAKRNMLESDIEFFKADDRRKVFKNTNLLKSRPPKEEDMVYVLRYKNKGFGASLMARSDILAEISDYLKVDFYIHPISVDELMIIPLDCYTTLERFCEILRAATYNRKLSKTYLTNRILLYKGDQGELVYAATA